MNVNNVFFIEKKRKLSNEHESPGKNSKIKNEDIKTNMIFKNIKKEPEFMVREVKKEVDFEVKEIKKEPYQSDIELVPPHFRKPPPKSRRRRRRQKSTKTNQTGRKTTAKNKKTSKKCKKSIQAQSCKRNKSKKSKRTMKMKTKKKGIKKSRNASKSTKKEPNTLLDRQNNGTLHLFGFKDELEYFSTESDHNNFKETSSRATIFGKRTKLSSLDARKKVTLALKSIPIQLFSNPKPVIQHPKSENIDLLDSILQSQALWHSKSSYMRVNEDGSVEVIERRNKKLMDVELTNDKKSNLKSNKTNGMGSAQERNNPACIEVLESLNLNKNIETYLSNINIKTEVCSTTETQGTEMVTDENKEQIWEKKIKLERKNEEKDLTNSLPSVSFLQESASTSESTFIISSKVEKLDSEINDSYYFNVFKNK